MPLTRKADTGWRREIVISPRFEGPPGITLGGYISGLMAPHLDSETVEVTMRKATPMGRPLMLNTLTPDRVFLYDRDTLLNEARPAATLEIEPPDSISLEDAKRASLRHTVTPYPNCYGCGSGRAANDGLHLRAGPVERRGVVAVDWEPNAAVVGTEAGEEVPESIVLTALECPIGKAMAIGTLLKPEELVVLGRMTTQIHGLPRVGESCYFVGWPIERIGRRIEIAGVLNNKNNTRLATARLTFVVLKEGVTYNATTA